MRIESIGPLDRRAARRFIELPFRLHGSEANWVPDLGGELRSLIARRHPSFAQAEAAFFLVSDGEEDLGRITALEHRGYNAHHRERAAFFCHLACVDDASVAAELFGAAEGWARSRGLVKLIGPKGFLRSAGQGLLVEGFERFPATGIPWNPPYYAALIEGAGFTKVTDLLSGFLDASMRGDERLYRVAEIARKRGAFSVLAFRRRSEFTAWVPALKRIQHEAFADNPNYLPSTDAEFDLMMRNMALLADLRIVRFILREGELAGFVGAFPNVGKGIKRAGGKVLPFGWFHILVERARSRALDLNGLGILPKYQRLGGDAVLFTELERRIRASRYEAAEFIQVDERNFASKSGIEHFPIRWVKRHRVYGKSLEEGLGEGLGIASGTTPRRDNERYS
jgi:hypothetical protein